jgi:tRNA dimethylallyltransferase
MKRPRVATLAGPTAVGKTAVALEIAQQLNAEIVNADSLQVYREMDIGTAKPTMAERTLVPHHLVDIVDPDEAYNAARYLQDGRMIISRLHDRGVPPLVVGGTGLYIKALLHGLLQDGEAPYAIRQRLREDLNSLGLAALYERLKQRDPVTQEKLPPGDSYRILRALEVMEATGRPMSALQDEHRFRDAPYETLKLGLNLPREELYARIDRRVEVMLAAGWLTEVRGLLDRYGAVVRPLKSLGYRHLIAYLKGEWDWEEAVESIKRETRHYAKRQLTWFGADPEVRWFHPGEVTELTKLLKEFFLKA